MMKCRDQGAGLASPTGIHARCLLLMLHIHSRRRVLLQCDRTEYLYTRSASLTPPNPIQGIAIDDARTSHLSMTSKGWSMGCGRLIEEGTE